MRINHSLHGDVMGLHANVKGISTLALILLIIASAIIGGIISYAFTIAYYTEIPQETTITITGIHINPENIRSFNVTVLNPSYSPSDANVTEIALSLKNGTKLYRVIETNPSIENGLKVRRGETLNITCSKIRVDNANMTFGEFAAKFTGEKIMVHVFAQGPAANMEAKLPYVNLKITTDFNPRVSFKRFNITLTNNPQSEVNLTITSIDPTGIPFEKVNPDFRLNPVQLPKNGTVCFQFNGSWHGCTQFTLSIYTGQGYIFRREVKLETAHATIQSVIFDANYTDRFDVTVYNLAESANPVNVKEVRCTLENGTVLTFDCGSAIVMPNTTRLFTFSWNWRDYRGKNVTVVAYFTQDFKTTEYRVTTPPPVMLRAEGTFNLRDKGRFNLTVLNHASSVETVNITKLVVKKTGEVLPIINGLVDPGSSRTFYCTFNWASFISSHGRNLTLTVYATTIQTRKEYTFDYSFTLPVAELNITAIAHTVAGGTGYLNITVSNLDHSVWNLTLSKVAVVVQGLSGPLEYTFPRNQVVVKVGGEAVLLLPFDWQRYVGKSLTVTVTTEELVEASASYVIT